MIAIISLAAFCASILTFFSGFGLATVLTPVFAIFFSIENAIALTAIVHFLNNCFKATLVGKYASKTVLIKFGLVALFFSYFGAKLLELTSGFQSLIQYSIGNKIFEILPVKLVIAALIFTFTLIELLPSLNKFTVHSKYLSIGGALSGFFGGFSGHQGALRTMFLSKLRLSKEAFIGTGVAIAMLIDISRLAVYSKNFRQSHLEDNARLLIIATLFALLGSLVGNRLLKKTTMVGVQKIVAVTLMIFSIAMGVGLI